RNVFARFGTAPRVPGDKSSRALPVPEDLLPCTDAPERGVVVRQRLRWGQGATRKGCVQDWNQLTLSQAATRLKQSTGRSWVEQLLVLPSLGAVVAVPSRAATAIEVEEESHVPVTNE